jgi:hypothetical protein
MNYIGRNIQKLFHVRNVEGNRYIGFSIRTTTNSKTGNRKGSKSPSVPGMTWRQENISIPKDKETIG